MDLRSVEGSRHLAAGARLAFEGAVEPLALVEGDYQVGFCLRTGREFGDFPNLARLHVQPGPPVPNLMPYAPQYQGTALLDYTFDVRIS